MGKFGKRLIAGISEAVAAKKTSKKQLTLSLVSLILAALILVSATYCWYALAKGTGRANNLNLSVGNGLRVNDLGDTSQKFKDESFLLPASSVDGRNLFFPTDGTDFSSETTKMAFRSANAGDRNFDYVQLDFNLTAEANYTTIYLHKDTSLTIDIPEGVDANSDYAKKAKQAEKALRAAIYYDGMEDPVVFTSQMNPTSVDAVKDIDRTTGRFLESDKQVAYPFKDYAYGKKQLAMLNQGETRPFSLIIWLEGTDENCTSDAVMLKQLKLNLKFTTSWDNTEEIIFEDNAGRNVKTILDENPQYSLVLNYNDEAHEVYNMNFTMQKYTADDNNYQWKCNLPGTALNDLTFRIIDDGETDSNEKIKYEWKQSTSGVSTLNRGTATKYYVETVNGKDSRGHWFDGDIEKYGEGRDDDNINYDDDW